VVLFYNNLYILIACWFAMRVKRVNKKVGVFSLFLVLLLGVVGFAVAGSQADIWTDQDDYLPGEIVLISGDGFLAEAELSVEITRPDDVVETCDVDECNEMFLDGPLSSDESGSFAEYRYDLNGIEGEYSVLVSDGENSAETTFTDSRVWVISPNGGEVWSGTNDIHWYYLLNPFGPWDYDLYYNPDSCSGDIDDWNFIDSYSCDTFDCFYAWDTTTVPDGDYCVGIIKTSGIYREDKSDDLFGIGNGFCGDGEIPIIYIATTRIRVII